MIRLPATTYILQLIASGTADVAVEYVDVINYLEAAGSQETNATAATQTICAAPAASTVREIDTVEISNTQAGTNTLTVQKYNSSGTKTTILCSVTVQQGDQLIYAHGAPWYVMDSSGNKRQVPSGLAIAAGKTLTVSNSLALAGTDGTTMTFPATSATLADTASGTWTPTHTGFTEIGAATISGKWTRLGAIVFFEIAFSCATTVASTAGSSYFDTPSVPVSDSAAVTSANQTSVLSYGNGIALTTSRIYTPAWTATANTVTTSGYYYVS